MENNKYEYTDLTFNDAVLLEKMRTVEEANKIIHLEKYGRQPEIGIPILDAFRNVGCPCMRCFRDDFLS